MVSEEGGKNYVAVRTLKIHKQLADSLSAALLNGGGDSSGRLSACEQEEAVASALVIAVYGIIVANPGLANDICIGLYLLCLGVQPGKKINVAVEITRVIACYRIKTEAVNVVVVKPIFHNALYLFANVFAVKIKVRHSAPELTFIGVLTSCNRVISTCVRDFEVVKITVITAGRTVFPDVITRILKPGVAIACVVNYKVDNNLDTPLVCFSYKLFKVLKSAVVGVYGIIVCYVVLVIGG